MTQQIAPLLSIHALNALDEQGMIQRLGPVVEMSPWLVQRAWAKRPFASKQAVFEALMACVRGAAVQDQLTLLRAHPELAGREAVAGTMTPESSTEQARLGLLNLQSRHKLMLDRLNSLYAQRFGFPFIVALRLHHSLGSVFEAFERRLTNSMDAELKEALAQVGEVIRGRLELILTDDAGSVSAAPT
jgi:2-oxo-4-hydroxy-4-carboxy-5-ureidoimidazoline decarboxylase